MLPGPVEWSQEVLAQRPRSLLQSFRISAVVQVIHSPGTATLEIQATPAAGWEVTVASAAQGTDDLYITAALLGMFDVLLGAHPTHPVRNLRIEIVRAEPDPVWSSALAFRYAGRKAASQLIAEAQAANALGY